MRPGVAGDEFDQRVGHGFEEGGGDSGRRHAAQGVSIAGRVLDSDQPGFAGNADFDGPPRCYERADAIFQQKALFQISAGDLGSCQIAQDA